VLLHSPIAGRAAGAKGRGRTPCARPRRPRGASSGALPILIVRLAYSPPRPLPKTHIARGPQGRRHLHHCAGGGAGARKHACAAAGQPRARTSPRGGAASTMQGCSAWDHVTATLSPPLRNILQCLPAAASTGWGSKSGWRFVWHDRAALQGGSGAGRAARKEVRLALSSKGDRLAHGGAADGPAPSPAGACCGNTKGPAVPTPARGFVGLRCDAFCCAALRRGDPIAQFGGSRPAEHMCVHVRKHTGPLAARRAAGRATPHTTFNEGAAALFPSAGPHTHALTLARRRGRRRRRCQLARGAARRALGGRWRPWRCRRPTAWR
jgi:hypothetical protein